MAQPKWSKRPSRTPGWWHGPVPGRVSDRLREASAAMVEAPAIAVAVQDVVVAADQHDRPPVVLLEQEHDVAGRLGLVVRPLVDVGGEHEVALREARCHLV